MEPNTDANLPQARSTLTRSAGEDENLPGCCAINDRDLMSFKDGPANGASVDASYIELDSLATRRLSPLRTKILLADLCPPPGLGNRISFMPGLGYPPISCELGRGDYRRNCTSLVAQSRPGDQQVESGSDSARAKASGAGCLPPPKSRTRMARDDAFPRLD